MPSTYGVSGTLPPMWVRGSGARSSETFEHSSKAARHGRALRRVLVIRGGLLFEQGECEEGVFDG